MQFQSITPTSHLHLSLSYSLSPSLFLSFCLHSPYLHGTRTGQSAQRQQLHILRNLVVKNKGWAQWIIFHNWNQCSEFSSVIWHCWLGDEKGIQPVKHLYHLFCYSEGPLFRRLGLELGLGLVWLVLGSVIGLGLVGLGLESVGLVDLQNNGPLE